MRFLLLTQYYPPEVGAASVRLQAMVRQLVDRGHEVEVVTALPNYPTGRIFPDYRRRFFVTEQRDGATVRRVWIRAATGSGFGRMAMFASFALLSLVGMFRSRRPDVVLVESPPLLVTIPALVHRFVRRSRNVLLLADLWPDTAAELGLLDVEGRTFKILRRLEDRVYQTSWRISPVTEGQVVTLTSNKGVPLEKIAFLPNGVDIDLFHPAQSEGGRIEVEVPVLLFAGTLGYAHGLDVVLDAAPLVRASHPAAMFLLVGGGSEKERLQARVRAESIEGVVFRDPVPVEEVAPLFRECYAGISCIRSLKVLEGARPAKVFPIMASGRPVVYSGSGEGARLVEDAHAGITVPPQDHEALAAAIIELLDDPERADQLGVNGRKYVEQHLAWDGLIDRWLADVGVPGA